MSLNALTGIDGFLPAIMCYCQARKRLQSLNALTGIDGFLHIPVWLIEPIVELGLNALTGIDGFLLVVPRLRSRSTSSS